MQNIEIIYLVREKGYPRIEATKLVAKKRSTSYQTIIDKYCRRLDKTSSEIDSLLKEENVNDFRNLLLDRFPGYKNFISEFFKKYSDELD